MQQSGKMCQRIPSETYTFDTSNGCDGWSNTNLDTCKQYCETNALPLGCSPPGEVPECRFLVWTKNANWCHLAKACTAVPQEQNKEKVLIEYKRSGKQRMLGVK